MTTLEHRLSDALRRALRNRNRRHCLVSECPECEKGKRDIAEAETILALFEQQRVLGSDSDSIPANIQAVYNFRKAFHYLNQVLPERLIVTEKIYHELQCELKLMPMERIMSISNVCSEEFIVYGTFKLFGIRITSEGWDAA